MSPVNYISDGYADGFPVYDMAECPNCGYYFEESYDSWEEPYCPHCGQHLDWYLKKCEFCEYSSEEYDRKCCDCNFGNLYKERSSRE